MTDIISINSVNLGTSMLSEHRDRDIKYLLELMREIGNETYSMYFTIVKS